MYLRVYESRDSSPKTTPSPSLRYSFTHTHRSNCYRNRNPQTLPESFARLMYLRVYDSPDYSRQSAPSPSLRYSLTHTHRSNCYRNRNPQPLPESSTRLMCLSVYDSRDSSRQPAPSLSLWYSLTHTHRSICYHNHNPHPQSLWLNLHTCCINRIIEEWRVTWSSPRVKRTTMTRTMIRMRTNERTQSGLGVS